MPYGRIEKNCARTKFFSGLSDDRANALMHGLRQAKQGKRYEKKFMIKMASIGAVVLLAAGMAACGKRRKQ